jgi:hypothetical protein
MRSPFRPARSDLATRRTALRATRAWTAVALALLVLAACLSVSGRVVDAVLGSAR